MSRLKFILNASLGISTEILYALAILLAGLLICLILFFRI